jgi:phosphatidate cytidylyltransferase
LIAPVETSDLNTGGSKRTSELQKRVLSALILAGLALSSAWYGGVAFAIVWGVASVAVLREWNSVIGFTQNSLWTCLSVGSVGIIASIVVVSFTSIAPTLAFLPAVLAGILAALIVKRPGLSPVWIISGPIYAASIIVGPLALRARGSEGLLIIVWLFFVVWVADIGAFFVGRQLGGPKLWPSVSPKKTWSGFLGGLVFGTIVPVATVYCAKIWLSVDWIDGWLLVFLTITTALVAECGDLFESAMKRRFGVKDTGTLIPGHGGLMDRLDSYTAAAFYLVVMTGFLAV